MGMMNLFLIAKEICPCTSDIRLRLFVGWDSFCVCSARHYSHRLSIEGKVVAPLVIGALVCLVGEGPLIIERNNY